MNLYKSVLALLTVTFLFSCSSNEREILVFSKTSGFRHTSIEAGLTALHQMAKDHNFKITTTEDASYFEEDSLKTFNAVVFLNTTGDVLDAVQQADFERYIQAGGGFLGIHAATDTEYDWPWFTELVGAQFKGHPEVQTAHINVIDNKHSSTQFLDSVWIHTDEWYNFKNFNSDVNVLLEVDETSYEGGDHGPHHPTAWYHEFDGGRAFYTAMGHTDASFSDPTFLKHLFGGIDYVASNGPLDYSKAKTERIPPENRFVKEVLDFNLDEPMELAELPGEGILFIERRGHLKFFNFDTSSTTEIATMDLFYGNEDGLLGLAVDPKYKENNWIYLFYSAADGSKQQRVSRFDLNNGQLDFKSEKILLNIPVLRECCHSGGGLEFGPNGNLFIGIGDNTNPFESQGFAPIDERANRALWDAQRSAANTNDLRGKILRIKPEADGTYSIPEGNLFPVGTPNTRPEIYVMGCRNPFRFSIDSKTGFVYWGDVGPDSGQDDPVRGPKGMGEFDQARKAGFWGWPYVRGNNQQYNDYDFTKLESGPKFDPQNLVNDSPNNTGIQNLPPAQESLIWYSYDHSEEFPWLGEGGVNPMAGVVYHSADYPDANENSFPSYFENKLFVYEWMRDWIYVVTLDESQNYVKADPFMPNTEFSHPMDMLFGTDGNMYLLEYGQKWNAKNLDARLSRISYIPGNRKPVAHLQMDKEIGAAPLTIQFSADASKDYDGDKLEYEWSFENRSIVDSKASNPTYTFEKAGVYQVNLKVSDPAGNSSETSAKILVGNTSPELNIKIEPSDSLYYNNKKVTYQVNVIDKEDGNSNDKNFPQERIKVTFSYIPEGEDLIKATLGHQQNVVPEGKLLMEETDCRACHDINEKVNGPSYMEIADKYGKTDRNYLIDRIKKGGSGVWGESLMSAHPQLSVEEIGKMVDYILSLDPNQQLDGEPLPLSGTLEFNEHIGDNNSGKYVLMASYLDTGNENVPNSSLSTSAQMIFKAPKLEAEKASILSDDLSTWAAGGAELVGSIRNNSHIGFENLDLKQLKSVSFSAFYVANYDYKGRLEIREGSPTGKIIGSTKLAYFDENNEALKSYSIPINATLNNGTLYLVFNNTEDPERFVANANWIVLNY
ncbi:ThuA domain-containing protein [Muricauda sp. 2012CJ35-5]|uniref:ThuA domain-containing protein n=1 Tax=Flagellimonas spongiicola TaxID=2942208 RepID=A0ABT0PQT2_9FLAO|nr:ThuA domain-containing protein [Allomuricauda spongiicola]MCL6273749.1 ThuA domain-containing protein [Allomuricauda spongiicola]